MSRIESITTDNAPKAIGPYSQAVVVDGWVYCSGQIALDAASGQVVVGDVAAQTERVLKNMAAVLEAAGASLASVVKTTVFLADMADFAAMNEVYGKHFGSHRPARSTVAAAGLPRSVRIEIDCVARSK
jgi:2-iminobutanoate/2-iminopropanoate deaminase